MLTVSLNACTSGAVQKMTGSPYQIDEYAGDSWQLLAGADAMPSIDERLMGTAKDNPTSYTQAYAYALGDGTDNVQHVTCDLDSEMPLKAALNS